MIHEIFNLIIKQNSMAPFMEKVMVTVICNKAPLIRNFARVRRPPTNGFEHFAVRAH